MHCFNLYPKDGTTALKVTEPNNYANHYLVVILDTRKLTHLTVRDLTRIAEIKIFNFDEYHRQTRNVLMGILI